MGYDLLGRDQNELVLEQLAIARFVCCVQIVAKSTDQKQYKKYITIINLILTYNIAKDSTIIFLADRAKLLPHSVLFK